MSTIALNGRPGWVDQQASHAGLLRKVRRSPMSPVRSKYGRLDAVIMPASSPARMLQPTIKLAAFMEVPLVVLCSKETKAEQVAQLASTTPRARTLIIAVPEMWTHPGIPKRTSAAIFQKASAHRVSDLSAKRNLGLLLARLLGWHKIAFVDDDINLPGLWRIWSITSLAAQLGKNQVAGMLVRKYPDNSVVCHARRLAGFPQDVFVTGAILGVRCNGLPLSFFPDIYNEDWFFFAKEAAACDLPSVVGHARQAAYDPFESPDRARREEFGDLLAEGLFALFGRGPSVPFNERLRRATKPYWSDFMEARSSIITDTNTALYRLIDRKVNNTRVHSALNSLAAATNQLKTITAGLCVNFIDAWRDDLDDWQRFSSSVNNVGSIREAMDFLELQTWTLAEFGAVIDMERHSIGSGVD
jgi:hypothetical protein